MAAADDDDERLSTWDQMFPELQSLEYLLSPKISMLVFFNVKSTRNFLVLEINQFAVLIGNSHLYRRY